MSEPPMLSGPEVRTQAHSIEQAMKARVIMDVDGTPASIILTGAHGSQIKMPGFAFPFVQNGGTVLAIISVVQVTTEVAKLGAPKTILRPGV